MGIQFFKRLFPLCWLGVVVLAVGCGDSEYTSDGGVASVVFDIDGTLTPCVTCLLTFRPEAVRAVRTYVDKGYAVIYMTARPRFLEGITLGILRGAGFPDLPLYTAETILAGEEETVDYKSGVLTELTETEDRSFLYAYGDSTTDFDAYNRAGVPEDQTFALLRRGDTECQDGVYEACLTGYEEHIAFIEALPDAN